MFDRNSLVLPGRHGVSHLCSISLCFLKNIQWQPCPRGNTNPGKGRYRSLLSKTLREQLACFAEMEPLLFTLLARQALVLMATRGLSSEPSFRNAKSVTTWDFLLTNPHRHASGCGGYIIFTPSSSFMSSQKQGQTAAFISA